MLCITLKDATDEHAHEIVSWVFGYWRRASHLSGGSLFEQVNTAYNIFKIAHATRAGHTQYIHYHKTLSCEIYMFCA